MHPEQMTMSKFIFSTLTAILTIAAPAMAAAEETTAPAMDHSQMDHSQMKHEEPATDAPADTHAGHGETGAMDHGSMQGGSPPPDARDPHAYAEGSDFGPYKLHLMDRHNFSAFLFDNLEVAHNRDHTSLAYDVQAWFGSTYDRLVLKAEGDADDGRLEEARTELLWSHAVAAYWDVQVGARADHGEGPDRNWLAFGVQGLAPYWFEIDATAYASDEGHTALRLDLEYELLLTQKLILQPRIEANFYGKQDAARGIGTGLSDLKAGLRLRYEIRREFAPYVGVEWSGIYGSTADFARAAGHDTRETRLVAGLRLWF